MKIIMSLWILFLCALICFADNFKIEALDIENKVISANEIKADETGNCEFIGSSGNRLVSFKDLLEVTFSSPLEKKSALWEITLSNKDILYGTIKQSMKDGIKLESPVLGILDLKFNSLLMIKSSYFTGQREITSGQSEDTIQLLNGDSDRGTISLIDDNSIKITSAVYKQEKDYSLKDIAVVTFSQLVQPPKSPEGIIATLIGTDGMRLTGQIKKIQDNQITFTSIYGLGYQLPLGKIAQIYFKNPRCVYLSDIEPLSVKEYPTAYDPNNILFPWKYQKDRNVMKSGVISVKGKRFYKGLSVHANCELTYNLNGEYKKFIATVGLDDVAGPRATVQFIVYLDGKKSYESKIIKWGDEPEMINLNVENTKEMKLVLNDGGDIHILDRADWGGARLIK
jgi:hypothetical protein